jgi:diphosphoinositol-polyphosphate diphosphatase
MTIPASFISADSSSVERKITPSHKSKESTSTSMHPSLPMSARTGRTTARYTPGSNRRLCAGIVALSSQSTVDSPGHHTHVLVTSSSRHPERFVLPKGGWEQDETAEHAALREGWEEGTIRWEAKLTYFLAAGVVGQITQFLAQVVDPRPPNKSNNKDKKKKHKVNGIVADGSTTSEEFVPRAEYRYYEVDVENLATEYPESGERIRRWVRLFMSN